MFNLFHLFNNIKFPTKLFLILASTIVLSMSSYIVPFCAYASNYEEPQIFNQNTMETDCNLNTSPDVLNNHSSSQTDVSQSANPANLSDPENEDLITTLKNRNETKFVKLGNEQIPPENSTAHLEGSASSSITDPSNLLFANSGTPTDGWTQSESCEWLLDSTGRLTIRPLANGESGNFVSIELSEADKGRVVAICSTGNITSSSSYFPIDFKAFPNLQRVELPNWVIPNVTKLDSLFSGLYYLKYVNLENLNSPNLIDIKNMFSSSPRLEEVNLKNFQSPKVVTINFMFQDCVSLNSVDISGWSVGSIKSAGYVFKGCNRLTRLDFTGLDFSSVITIEGMFESCESLKELKLFQLTSTSLSRSSSAFEKCKALEMLDLSSWNTESLLDVSYMFYDCSSLKNINLSNWKSKNIKNMNGMFDKCTSLTEVLFEGWEKVCPENISSIFLNCYALQKLDLGWLDTRNLGITVMPFAFASTAGLKSIKLPNTLLFSTEVNFKPFSEDTPEGVYTGKWVSNDLPNEGAVFLSGNSFLFGSSPVVATWVPEFWSRFDISKTTITVQDQVFTGLEIEPAVSVSIGKKFKLRPNIDYSVSYKNNKEIGTAIVKIEGLGECFGDNFTTFNIIQNQPTTGWIQVETCEYQLKNGVLSLRPLGGTKVGVLSNFEFLNSLKGVVKEFKSTGAITYVGHSAPFVISEFKNLEKAIIPNWTFSSLIQLDNLFINSNLVELNLSNWELPNITSYSGLFMGNTKLKSIVLDGWDTLNIDDMSYMFFGCESLEWIDLSKWNISNVKSIESMFESCVQLVVGEVGLNEWDTSNVNNMNRAFSNCNLGHLDLSKWKTPSLESMQEMFSESYVNSLNISNFDTSKIQNMDGAFSFCPENSFEGFELVLGEKWRFVSNAGLIDVKDQTPYGYFSGKWVSSNAAKPGPFNTSEFVTNYNKNPSLMAGSWAPQFISRIDISNAIVSYSGGFYEYDGGSLFSPEVYSVYLGEHGALTPRVDYEVSYSNNTNAGTAYVYITGIGNYSGVITRTFTITPCSIDKAEFFFKDFYFKDGSLIVKPDGSFDRLGIVETVIFKASPLKAGEDYSITYSFDNQSLIIQGIGNFKGSFSKHVNVSYSIEYVEVRLPSEDQFNFYNSNFVYVNYMYGNKKLSEGLDYLVQNGKLTALGSTSKHVLRLEGRGNFVGSKEFEIDIPFPSLTGTWVKTKWEGKTRWAFLFDKKSEAISLTNRANGLVKIDNKIYLFDAASLMVTGWQRPIDNMWLYFASDGSMKTSSWVKSGKNWYYMGADGFMQTGRQVIDGKTYFFSGSGAMKTGWVQDGGNWYFFDKSGAAKTGWVKSGKSWYYMDSAGIMQTGQIKIDGKYYYLAPSGAMKTGWVQDASGLWNYYNKSGEKLFNRWIGNYWIGADGVMATNAWVDNDRYYVGANGKWVKGAVKPSA